ncbi:MAG: mechanosensitive ion channel [Candidatus Sumerlaeia bacterium]|nr:mechanosensitive ion channel [Candidatus Sumerlaeia bacterium]
MIRYFAFVLFILLSSPTFSNETPQVEADLSTPYRTLQHFIFSCRDGNFEEAALAFDMALVPGEDPARLARRFKFVLDRYIWVDWDHIPDSRTLHFVAADDTEAPEHAVATVVRDPYRLALGTIPYRGRSNVTIYLVRQELTTGEYVWRFSPNTVRMMPGLYNMHGLGLLEGVIPVWMEGSMIGDLYTWQWIGLGVVLIIGCFIMFLIAFILKRIGRFQMRRNGQDDDSEEKPLLVTCAAPLALMATLIVTYILVLNVLRLSVNIQEDARKILGIVLTVTAAWLAMRVSGHAIRALEERQKCRVKNAARQRAITTRMMVLQHVSSLLILIIGTGGALAQVEPFRAIGASLLASAGVAGIAIGLAAQRTLSNLIAGIQIAITQPVRVGDSVVIQGEWGWVEDITLTYVVVRVWDLRRLVLPIHHLLENPFQNWTIRDPHLIGTVFMHADYRLNVDDAREALKEILENTELWDRRVPPLLAVTEWRQETVELRALCSAQDAGTAWDLRCHVREKLLEWLKTHEDGKYLPRTRVTLTPREGEELGDHNKPPDKLL